MVRFWFSPGRLVVGLVAAGAVYVAAAGCELAAPPVRQPAAVAAPVAPVEVPIELAPVDGGPVVVRCSFAADGTQVCEPAQPVAPAGRASRRRRGRRAQGATAQAAAVLWQLEKRAQAHYLVVDREPVPGGRWLTSLRYRHEPDQVLHAGTIASCNVFIDGYRAALAAVRRANGECD